MGDLNVIDRFMATFIRYIDSGFGLLNDDVARLSSILIGIDITLAGLFWVLDSEANVLGRLLKKILYVGVFALILNNFRALGDIIYRSFAGLGLNAADTGLTPGDLLKPGRLAGTGSSFIGFYTTAVGAVLGAAIGQAYDGSVQPILIGFGGLSVVALFVVLWTERGRLFQVGTPDSA